MSRLRTRMVYQMGGMIGDRPDLVGPTRLGSSSDNESPFRSNFPRRGKNNQHCGPSKTTGLTPPTRPQQKGPTPNHRKIAHVSGNGADKFRCLGRHGGRRKGGPWVSTRTTPMDATPKIGLITAGNPAGGSKEIGGDQLSM